MNLVIRRLVFGLVIALTTAVATQSASAARQADDPIYCVDEYIASQFPDCVQPPAPSKDYRGEPVAIGDKKNFPFGTKILSVNVLKNDAVQNKKMATVKITSQRPLQTGVKSWVHKNKIFFTSFPGKHGDMLPNGHLIKYQVIDFKGRASADTYVAIRMKG